jgi:hypothetical protein
MASPSADRRAPHGWLPGREQYRAYRTITDCALFHRNLAVSCQRCKRKTVFDGHALWWLFERRGWDDRLIAISRRFRCTACTRAKGAGPRRSEATVTVTVTEAPATVPLPMPDERAWKRLVSRQRS